LQAALLSLVYKLPLAGSIILATARLHDASLWTQDEHFKNLANVEYIEKTWLGAPSPSEHSNVDG
jgi:predicted nucleic acid-binding protein